MKRCALAPVPPNGKTLSERLLAGGRRRRRRRSRGRVRAWRSSRERVTDASSRRLAATPPRRRSRHIHAPHYYVIRTSYAVMLHFILFIFFVRRTRITVHVLHVAFTSRGRANRRIPVALFTYSSRGRALCCYVVFLCSLSDSRRIFVALRLYQPVRRSAFALNQNLVT